MGVTQVQTPEVGGEFESSSRTVLVSESAAAISTGAPTRARASATIAVVPRTTRGEAAAMPARATAAARALLHSPGEVAP